MITVYDCDGHTCLNFVFLSSRHDIDRIQAKDDEMQNESCPDLIPIEQLPIQDDSFQAMWGAPILTEDFWETPTWHWDERENPF